MACSDRRALLAGLPRWLHAASYWSGPLSRACLPVLLLLSLGAAAREERGAPLPALSPRRLGALVAAACAGAYLLAGMLPVPPEWPGFIHRPVDLIPAALNAFALRVCLRRRKPGAFENWLAGSLAVSSI